MNVTAPIACNTVPGAVNLLDGVVDFADYGYLVNEASTYA